MREERHERRGRPAEGCGYSFGSVRIDPRGSLWIYLCGVPVSLILSAGWQVIWRADLKLSRAGCRCTLIACQGSSAEAPPAAKTARVQAGRRTRVWSRSVCRCSHRC